MADTPAVVVKKAKVEVTMVKMQDGREVGFAGKRKLVKSTLIDEKKVIVDDTTVTMEKGAVSVRLDFRDGSTRTFPLNITLLPKYAGHGAEQKFGDELAAPASEPLSEADMVVAVDDLNEQVNVQGNWSAAREGGGGGFSGASIVIKAICEASGKAVDEVKAFLQKKLDAATAKGEKLSRKDLYSSFRNPNSKTGQIIERMEKEERAKNNKVDADTELAALQAG